MVILGLDVGTTGCKCAAFTDGGAELCTAYSEYTNIPGNPNLKPRTLRNSVFGVVRDCVAMLEDSTQVAAIAISSFGESVVALDGRGEPLGDIVMYYVDSANDDFFRIVGEIGAERIMQITRVKPDTMYSLAKMLPQIKEHGDKIWKFLEIEDYIAFCLCRETVTDYSLATRTLLFDLENLRWSDELLKASGIGLDTLSTPVPSGSAVGAITPEAARELGLGGGVKIVICAQDQITNALGSGVLNENEAVDGNGTVECVTPLFKTLPPIGFTRRNYVSVPYLDKGYATYAFNFTGGSLLQWYKSAFGQNLRVPEEPFYDYMNRMCPSAPTGMLVLPHFQGAGGTPDMIKDAKGVIWGLDLGSDAFSVYRALMEGLSFEMKINLETIAGYGIKPTRIFASGGGARSAKWLQIKADVWNCEVIPVLTSEAGAQGAAIMAAAALNGETAEAASGRFVKHGAPVAPNPEFAGVYAGYYERYKALREYSFSQCRDLR